MEWQEGNKQRLKYWQWHRSFIHGDSNWKIFQVGYPVDMYLSPNWMLSRVRSVKHFFRNAFSRAHCGVLVPTSLWLGPIDSLPFATVVFWLHFFFLKEKHRKKLLCQLFTATSCSTLAQHALKLICQTTFDSILFKSLLSHCCDIVLSWRHGGHVTETWDFQLHTMQLLEASCLFSFKSILLRTSGKCQSIKRTACMLNFIYIVQCKWYLWLKISVQGPFKKNMGYNDNSLDTNSKRGINVQKQTLSC